MEEPQGLEFQETAKWQFAHVTHGVFDPSAGGQLDGRSPGISSPDLLRLILPSTEAFPVIEFGTVKRTSTWTSVMSHGSSVPRGVKLGLQAYVSIGFEPNST